MKRVLLADDSVAARKSIQTVLEVAGIEVVAVGNGELALSRLGEVSPEMVLLDAIMPGKSGYEVCAEIKRDPAHATLPVLLITSEFEPYDEALAEQSKADGHLTKPLDLDAIARIRDVWAKFVPDDADRFAAVADGLESKVPPKPKLPSPGPESFITSTTMRVADLEAAQAKRAEETQPAGSGGRRNPDANWGSALPDHVVDTTDAPAGVPSPLRGAPTTEALAHGASPGAPSKDAVRSVPIQDLHAAGERCTACGAGLVSGDIFCLACGAMVLVTSEEAEKMTRTQYCVECKQEVLPGEIFCVACGAVV